VEKEFHEDMRAMRQERVSFLALAVYGGGQRAVEQQKFTSPPFEAIIDRMVPDLPKRAPADILEYLVKHPGDMVTAREIGEVFQIPDEDAEKRLTALEKAGFVIPVHHAGADFWTFLAMDLDRLPLDVVRISHVPPEVQIGSTQDLRPIISKAVQNLYTQVANAPGKSYHFPLGREALDYVGYAASDLEQLPPTAIESFAGVGHPFAADVIRPGHTVLDIGSGSGTDVLVASLKTGPEGRVHGLDVTPAMIAKARRNIEAMGVKHVEILEGDATEIPLPDVSIDVVTSNGVLNLVPDKPKAFAEIFRVLKPGGRLQLADIVVQEDVSAVCGVNPQLWADCIGGAAVERQYLETIKDSGFRDVQILKRLDYFAKSSSEYTRNITKTFDAESVVVTAQKT
jgi:ubiquinone/menaquinone biosynthesis C-methylase UbiE